MEGALDSSLMKYMIEAMGVYPVGSLVLLRSQRLALVIDQSTDNPASPRVWAFYSAAQNKTITPTRIDLAECFGEDAIEGVASPETYGIADFPKPREKLFASASQKRNYPPPCQGGSVVIHPVHESRGTRRAYEAGIGRV